MVRNSEDAEALEDEMDELNQGIEASDTVDEITQEINETISMPGNNDGDHPIMVRAICPRVFCILAITRFCHSFLFLCP